MNFFIMHLAIAGKYFHFVSYTGDHGSEYNLFKNNIIFVIELAEFSKNI